MASTNWRSRRRCSRKTSSWSSAAPSISKFRHGRKSFSKAKSRRRFSEPEGPFSEFQDYYLTGSGMNPIVNIKADNDAQRCDLQERPERHRSRRLRVPQSSRCRRRSCAARAPLAALPDVRNVLVHTRHFRRRGADAAALLRRGAKRADVGVIERIPTPENRHRGRRSTWTFSTTRKFSVVDQHAGESGRRHRGHTTARRFTPWTRHVRSSAIPGAPGWHRIGGKIIIDATKPPECDPKRSRRIRTSADRWVGKR